MGKLTLAVFLIFLCSVGNWPANAKGTSMKTGSVNSNEVKIRIGSKSFAVTLLDNESTKRLREMFPLTIHMQDVNRNEKAYDLPKSLPTNASSPKVIKAGDIMLYGSNTLVVFYKSFPTSYSYTKLGQVDDTSMLESTLGSDDVTVTFEIER